MNGTAWLQWVNTNSAAIQAASTVILVVVTSWYAVRTHQLTSITSEQLKLVRRSQMPDLAISFCGAMVSMSDGGITDAFSLSAANRGLLPVTVDAPFIQLPDKRTIVFLGDFLHSDVQFPHRLEPGEGCAVLIDIRSLSSSLTKAGYTKTVEIRGAYRDKIGTVYLSEPSEFEPHVWIKRMQEA